MSRRSRRQSDTAVTLFPFLAVLICTMGSLIVLLVVVVQQAGNDDSVEETLVVSQELPPDVEKQKELQQVREDLAWQAEMLAKSREKTLNRLKSQQLELSRAEDQARQIKAELDRLYLESENLANLNEQQTGDADQVASEQAALQQKINEAALRLAHAQDAVQRKKRQFALIPYEGPNGTQRRPIYIECLNDRIVLQPEGVILKSADFVPPVESDNALASAIRAVREYYVNNGIVRSSTEPYPLIVVRPNGASAFAACRGALQGWDDEFGYELLPYHIELAYPQVDAGLRALLERTVEEARWRKQQNLVPDAPAMVLSVNSRTGGFVRQGSSGGGATGHGVSANKVDRESDFAGPSGGAGSGSADLFGLTARGGANRLGPTGASGGVAPGGTGEGSRDPDREFAGVIDAAPRAALDADPAAARDVASRGTPDGRQAGNPTTRPSETPLRPGEYREPGDRQNAGTPSANPSFDALANVDADRSAASGQASGQASGNEEAGSGATARLNKSIARRQGSNWALPGAADGSIAIQRPVAVVCAADILHLVPEAGSEDRAVDIPWKYGTESAVREMVSALWTRIDGWGIAGVGAYWKPVIEFSVRPEAEHRYEEVAALLDDSGIIVIRR